MEIEQDILREEKLAQELEFYQDNQINWLPDDTFFKTWDGIKGHMKKMWGHKTEFIEANWKKFFLAYSRDLVKGKPQLVFPVMQRIPLIRVAVNKQEEYEMVEGEFVLDEKGKKKKTSREIEIQTFYFFDEKFDKRHDGFQKDCFSLDFWMYKLVTSEGKEVFIWTPQQLPNCTCEFKGMMVDLEDMAELSRNMKVKSIGKIFFMKEFNPDVKILSKEQIINYTKSRQIDELDWNLFLNYHPNGNINIFDDDVQLLRSAVVLSGKRDGYGLHLGIMGKAGTKKSMGWLETLDYKFEGDDK